MWACVYDTCKVCIELANFMSFVVVVDIFIGIGKHNIL